MNLGQLIQACEFRSGFNDSAYHPEWISFINESIRSFALRHPWPGLEDLIRLTSDGTHFLILPHFVDSIVSILNISASAPVDRFADFDRSVPSAMALRTPGTVLSYDKIGTVPCLRDPTGYIYVKSSSASDVSPLLLSATGYVANSGASGTGMERTLKTMSLAPTGLNAATFTSLFTSIISISKVTETFGDFYFYDAADSDRHISFIANNEIDASFKRVQLLYKPASQTLFDVRFRHKVPPLLSVEQAPHPSVDPDFIIQYALSCFWKAQQQFTKGQMQDVRALQILQDKAHKENNFDEPFEQMTPIMDPADRDPTLW